MRFQEAMQTLQQMGTAQNVKIYRRHGAGDNLFGVSFANLKKLQKQIKTDQELAEQLWETGNTDAQTLAIMVADPDAFTAASADAWLKDITYYLLSDMYGGMIARSRLALGKFKKWSRSRREYTRACGFSVLSSTLGHDAAAVDDELCREALQLIESEIHASPNRSRHAMNGALISIGIFKPSLRQEAIETARRIGAVEVDHGETSCKTPPAEDYIRKAVSRSPRKKK